ncbi:MAG: NADH-quinone oxidoreductase subunit NuoE [Hyphomicrobiales bacterium]|nr:MAG: NADH-quinone oxidoreductase subunit NuoE [Hyphomicrobiales bacterium]
MSVRRLAVEAIQPQAFAFNRANASWAKKKIKNYPKGREASAIIPLLMRAQEQDGWVTKAAIEHMADMLDMPLIRVLEVATFYTQFQLAPVGKKAHIQVCGTTPCMLRGSGDLIALCKKRIAEKPFELTDDEALSWEEVECQGACVNAPMVMIFKDTYEDLTPERLEEIIDAFEAGKGDSVPPGPQIDRIYSAPVGGLTSLTGVVAKPAARKAPAKKTAAVKKAAPKKAVPKKAAPNKPVAKKTDAKAAPVASLKDANRPEKIKKPTKPDDLKMISGVGPKLEGTLNKLGIYKFEQVAKWKKAERQWVDGYLSFKGRIDREDWVKQAKALAKGGAEEYIRVFGKKPR